MAQNGIKYRRSPYVQLPAVEISSPDVQLVRDGNTLRPRSYFASVSVAQAPDDEVETDPEEVAESPDEADAVDESDDEEEADEEADSDESESE